MQIIVLAGEEQRRELEGSAETGSIVWVAAAEDFLAYKNADAFIDLEFVNEPQRVNLLAQLLPSILIINSVTDTLQETHSGFIRINGWSTFLASPLWEASAGNDTALQKATEVFSALGKKAEWLQDEPGFITARVICMIVNEAFIALAEAVSTKDEINTAMKLGTAYPYGPFEWAEKIGLQNIVTLLQKLSYTNARYKPAEYLLQETNKSI